MSAPDRLETARALALALVAELEVRLVATRMKPRGRRLDALAEVAHDIDQAVEAAERALGPRWTWAREDRR